MCNDDEAVRSIASRSPDAKRSYGGEAKIRSREESMPDVDTGSSLSS